MLTLFAAVCLCLPSAATASRPFAADSVWGVVQDSAGAPLAGAAVSLAELERATVSDAGGRFSIQGPPGRYRLVAVLTGFHPFSGYVTLPASTSLVVVLQREATELSPITVTAARAPIDVQASPMVTSELSGRDLRRSAGVSLAHAISRLPGVRTLSTGEQVGKPMIRGLVGSRVLVLEEGLRLEDYSWSDEDGPSVDARLAERVEVVRGPASLMYGSDAIAGVVNVLPAPLPDAGGGPGFTRLRTELSGATNNAEASAAVGLQHAGGRFGARLFAIGRRAGNLHTPEGELDNTGFSALNGEAAVGVHSRNGTTTLRFARYGGEFQLLEAGGPGADTAGAGGPERKADDVRLQLLTNHVLGAVRLEANAQWQHHWMSELSDEAPATGGGTKEGTVFDLALDTWSGDVLLHHTLGARVNGTLGSSGMYQRNDTRGPVPLIPDARIAGGGLFAIERLDLGRIALLGGIRGDLRRVSADGDTTLHLESQSREYTAWSGDLGVVIPIGRGLALAGNVGRAWRAPNLFELFAYGPRLGEARFDIGDPALLPEHSLNLDLSFRWQSRAVEAEVAAYRNRITDFIYGAPTTQTQDSLRVFRYGQTDATLDGGEARLVLSPLAWLTIGGRGEVVWGTDDRSQQPLPLIPPFRVTFEVEAHSLRLGWLENGRIGTDVELVGQKDQLGTYTIPGQGTTVFDLGTSGYALLNLYLGGAHRFGSQDLSIELEARNLANARYRDYLSRYKEFALNPGRNIILRLALGF